MSTRFYLTLAALAALGLAAAHPAAAQTTIYNFEVQGGGGGGGSTALYNGTGALAGAGTTWNVINTPVANALDSNGGASTVGFTADIPGTYTSPNNYVTNDPQELLSNFAYTSGGGLRNISITGLGANSSFVLDLYGINGNYASTNTIFRITASDHTTVLQTKTATANRDDIFVEGDNYVQFTGTADSAGSLYATFQTGGRDANEGDFNGAQIAVTPNASAAPEPAQTASLGLTAFALFGVILKAAKRKTVTAAV